MTAMRLPHAQTRFAAKTARIRAGQYRPGDFILADAKDADLSGGVLTAGPRRDATGTIVGLTRGSGAAHIARAALESIAYQSAALLQAMSRDVQAAGGVPVTELRVDGGACVNNLLMQFQADLLGIPVVRPKVIETTALGAAYLAGLACGVYHSLDELAALWQVERRFLPTMPRGHAEELMHRWEKAVRQATLD